MSRSFCEAEVRKCSQQPPIQTLHCCTEGAGRCECKDHTPIADEVTIVLECSSYQFIACLFSAPSHELMRYSTKLKHHRPQAQIDRVRICSTTKAARLSSCRRCCSESTRNWGSPPRAASLTTRRSTKDRGCRGAPSTALERVIDSSRFPSNIL